MTEQEKFAVEFHAIKDYMYSCLVNVFAIAGFKCQLIHYLPEYDEVAKEGIKDLINKLNAMGPKAEKNKEVKEKMDGYNDSNYDKEFIDLIKEQREKYLRENGDQNATNN